MIVQRLSAILHHMHHALVLTSIQLSRCSKSIFCILVSGSPFDVCISKQMKVPFRTCSRNFSYPKVPADGAFFAFISSPRTTVLIPSIASNGVHSLHGVFGTNKIPFARFLVLRKSRAFCSAWIVNGYFLRSTWSS